MIDTRATHPSQSAVVNSLIVSGAYQRIEYEKYATTDIQPFKLFVTNSSDIFAVQFYYTGSATDNVIITSGSTPINRVNAITLPPRSGSNVSAIELLMDVDTIGLDEEPLESLTEENQLLEGIHFNAVALIPQTNVEVSNIVEVNTLSSPWRELTERGETGLGVGYTETSRVNFIQFTREELLAKKARLEELKEFFNKGYGYSLASIGKGASNRAQKQRGFKILLYAILHKLDGRVDFNLLFNVPPREELNVRRRVIGWKLPSQQTVWESFFVWNNLSGFEGSLGINSYPAQKVTQYIDLIDNILDIREGLSTQLPPSVETTIVVDELSRVNIKVGELDIDVVNASYSIINAIQSASRDLIRLQTSQFFDEYREYKTILNFSDNKQYVVEAWRPVPDTASIQLKLLKPLEAGVSLYDQAYIVREFAKPIIDTINIELAPPVDDSPYLRPANMNVGKFETNKQTITNATLTSLEIDAGSVGVVSNNIVSYDDRIFNRWYTADFNSSELNIDFSDYANFVLFGSAKARLNSFANKLRSIKTYENIIIGSGSGERALAIEKENIIRNFDPYEQYLYFASQSNAYSASAYYVDGGIEYNATGSWPKDTNMNVLDYDNVEEWYTTQSAIAERFDEFNPNYLIKHLPEYIQEDTNSVDFITFIQMFGHIMDNVKIYIDQFSNIYSTNPDPFKDLTMDQVYEVGKSFGLDLPNAYSLEGLESFIASLYDGAGTRARLAETWKRFLHSSIYLKKLKGSKTGVDAVINTFGLNSPLVQLKESTYAVEGNYITSDELVYALQFTGSVSSSIQLPFVSSSYTASTLQMRFAPKQKIQSSVLSSNGMWAIDLVPHPSASVSTKLFNTQSNNRLISYYTLEPQVQDYGTINIVSGSNRVVIASSSYFPLFSETYTHIMLRSQSQDIVIVQTDGDQILFQQSASVAWDTLWNNTTHVHVGASGSIKFGVFDGIVDDVRIWGENTTTDNFIKQAYDPGAYYGSNYSASYDSLYVDLSFSQQYAAVTQSATNETPYFGVANLSNLPAVGFTTSSYVRILRSIKQFTPIVGASIFSNRKVTVADPPTFNEQFIDDNGTKTLLVNGSIKSIKDKQYVGGQKYVQFAVSPTDFINQTIMRSMGDIDTNYLIGSPREHNNERYKELDNIFNFFLEYYNESVNVNQYIRFFRNVLEAPSEYMGTYIPARATLVDGIVIESPFLDRKKIHIQKSIGVDGSNTRTFDKFVLGSGSANVGAYDFLAVYPRDPEPDTTVLNKPVMQKFGLYTVTSSLMSNTGVSMIDAPIELTSLVGPVSSTIPSKLAPTKQWIQKIGTAPRASSFASSSLADRNSGIGFVDAHVKGEARTYVTQSGYARNVYSGLQFYASQIYRISSEENTIAPFYEIGPASDFSDAGTTTYFYNKSGVYWFPNQESSQIEKLFTKRVYRAKLDVPIGEIQSIYSKTLNNITLLSPQILADYPGRTTLTINSRTYPVASVYKGTLNIANIMSLYSVRGASGLRLRLYRSPIDQDRDVNREFSTIPNIADGVMFDGLLENDTELFPYTLIHTKDSTLYFTVTNTTGSAITSSILLTYFEYEPSNLVPSGYLPRHYRFTRTNNIAALRRSFLGCRAVFCPEGCPPDVTESETDSPVQVFLTPRTSPTTENNPENDPFGEIIREGTRGKLNI